MTLTIIDKGTGPPVLLIPGIHGRPEYLWPAIEALADSCRVVAFPLCGEPGSGLPYDQARGYDNYVDQIDRIRADRDVSRATLVGVSAGGHIALRYAAERPQHVSGLVLVSTPPPRWQPERRVARYVRTPWRSALLFFATAPGRLGPEIRTALCGVAERRRFVRRQLSTLWAAPLSPTRMAARATLMADTDLTADCARVRVPTLVITGEQSLDRVVPIDDTLQYVCLIEGTRHAVLERTGHLGSITRPVAFATLVGRFIDRQQITSARSEVA
jgi:pimeloyl-ACP methyl ester carboxylesterase